MKPETLITHLIERRETVATAESLTAGLVCATLTEVPGSSAAVRGGLVVYATDLKAKLAGVDEDLLAAHGAVHPEVAAQLAMRRAGSMCRHVGPRPDRRRGSGRAGRRRAGHRPRRPRGPGVLTVRTLDLSGDRASVRAGAVSGAFALLGEHLA